MRVVVLGAGGQLGGALVRSAPAEATLSTFTHTTLDISDVELLRRLLLPLAPQLIINAAAYTQVDAAESDEAAALRANAVGPALLATLARDAGARLIHVSTDFVFDGTESRPYEVDSETRPLGAYGRSKLAGERAVLGTLQDRSVVLRTAWLYAAKGRNFVNTMLRLMATRESIGVVMDQVGSPTWATSLAAAIWAMARNPEIRGVQHWCDAGVASWYDFAVAIQEEALNRRLLDRCIPVRAIRTVDYPTPARRPRYSVLDTRHTAGLLGFSPRHWRDNLRKSLDELVPA